MKKLNVKKRVTTILLAVLAAVSLGLACFFMSTPNTNVVGANQSAHSTAFGVPSGHDGESATSTALSESNISSGVITIASPGSYYLSADLDARIEVDLSESEEENKTVHLCLNGHILNAGGTDSAVKVRENTTLVLHDCGSTTHYYTEGSDGAYDFDGVTSETDNAQSLTGGVITGGSATNGGGVYVKNGASFIMLGGNISGNTATQAGGGVYYASGSSGGTFEYSDITNSATNLTATGLAGGRIIGNAVTGDEVSGGGVYTAASLTLSGVEISNNTVNSVDNNRGGGVAIYGSSSSPITVTMTGGTISGNSAPLGGGVSVRNHATFTLSAGEISENSAPRATSGHGNDNSAHSSGGGVNVGSNGTFNMSGGSISGNISGNDSNDNDNDYGGGVYVYAGTFTMTGGTISGNEADDGGGIYVNSADKIENNNGALLVGGVDVVISNNIARHNGGGIYLNRHSQATINGATIGGSSDDLSNGNYAQSFGGGIYINRGDAEMVILKATITYNQAMTGGGAYVHSSSGESGSLVLGDSSTTNSTPDVVIVNNSAIYYGSRPTEKMNGYGGGVFMRNAGDAGTSYESNIDIFGYVIITENDSLPDGQVKAAADNLYLERGITINEHTSANDVDGSPDTTDKINTASQIGITLSSREDNYYDEDSFVLGNITYGEAKKIFKADADKAEIDINKDDSVHASGDKVESTDIVYALSADVSIDSKGAAGNYENASVTEVTNSGTTVEYDNNIVTLKMEHRSENLIFAIQSPSDGDIVYVKVNGGINGANEYVYYIPESTEDNLATFQIPYSAYSGSTNSMGKGDTPGIHIIYSAKQYKLTYANIPEGYSGAAEHTYSISDNTTLTAPSLNGYNFTGWSVIFPEAISNTEKITNGVLSGTIYSDGEYTNRYQLIVAIAGKIPEYFYDSNGDLLDEYAGITAESGYFGTIILEANWNLADPAINGVTLADAGDNDAAWDNNSYTKDYDGENITLTVNHSGPPIGYTATYQWYKDGNEITDNATATGKALVLTAAGVEDAGVYHCVVTFVEVENGNPAVTATPQGGATVVTSSATTDEYTITINGEASVTFDSDTTEYNTVEDAFDAVYQTYSTDSTSLAIIDLLMNASVKSTLTVDGDYIEFDLNGHILSAETTLAGSLITVSSGSLTIVDSGSNVAHKYNIASENEATPLILEGGLWVFDENGTNTMYGGVITYGYAYEEGSVEIGDYSGGGINVDGGTLIMQGGTIAGNAALAFGGGVHVSKNGTFTMSGGTISGNTSVFLGGGVSVLSSQFTMTGGTIIGNHGIEGDSVYVASQGGNASSFTMEGGYLGGEVTNEGGSISMSGGYLDAAAYNDSYNATSPDSDFIASGYIAVNISAGNHYGDTAYQGDFPYAIYTLVTPDITLNPVGTIVYDGSPIVAGTDFTIGATWSGSSLSGITPSYTYKYVLNGQTEPVDGLPTNAGTYTITATMVGTLDGNKAVSIDGANKIYYAPGSTTHQVTISKREVTLNWSAPADLVYDGNAKVPTVTLGNVVEGEDVKVSIALSADNDNVNVGTFTYYATGLSGEAAGNYTLPENVISPEYTITQATYDMSEVAWDYVAPFTYDGTPWRVNVINLPDGVTAVLGGEYVETDAGNYTATVTFEYDSVNYVLENVPEDIYSLAWAINDATVEPGELTFTSAMYVYDGKEHTLTVTGDLPEGVKEVVYTDNSLTNVGSLTVTASFVMEDNYAQLEPMTATLTITKRDIAKATLEVTGEYTYDKGEQRATFTITDGDITITANDYMVGYSNNINAGTATIILTATADGNYKGSISANFTIGKATPTIPTAPEIDGDITYGDPVGDIELPDDWEWKDPEQTPTVEEGENGITVTIPVDDDNYDWTDVDGYNPETGEYETEVEVPVNPATPNVSAPVAQSGLTYGVNLADIGLTAGANNFGVAEGATWQWVDGTIVPTVTNDGYYARIAVDTDNFNWTGVDGYEDGYLTVLVEVTLNKATPEVPQLPQIDGDITYGDPVGDIELDDEWEWKDPEQTPTVEEGENGITVTIPVDDDNYDWTGVDGYNPDTGEYETEIKVPVNKVKVTIPTAATGLVYDGRSLTGVEDGEYYSVIGGTAINAGSYNATVSLDDPANYEWSDGTTADRQITWGIAKRSITVTVNEGHSSVYGEQIADISGTITSELGLAEGDEQSEVYSLSTRARQGDDIGLYDVTLSVLDDNYNITLLGGEDAYEITVKTLTIDWTVSGDSAEVVNGEIHVTYSEDGHIIGAEANTALVVDGEVVIIHIVCDGNTAENHKLNDAGNYSLTATIIDVTGGKVENYKLSGEEVMLFIEKANAVLPVTPSTGTLTYGQSLSEIKLEGGWQWVDGDIVPAVSDSNKTLYEVTIAVDDKNYNWEGVEGYEDGYYTTTVTVTVNKAPVDELPTPPDIEGGIEYGDPVGDIELPGDWEWKDPDETPTVEEGEEGITVTTPVDDDNYDWTDIPGYNPETGEYETDVKVPVNKAEYDMSGVIFADATFEYDGTAHYILVAGSLPEGMTVAYSNNPQIDAGVYTVTAYFYGDENHYEVDPVTATLTITQRDIAKATLTVTGEYVYNGGAQQATFTIADGNIPITDGDYTVSYSNNVNAGTAAITLTGTGNYTGSIGATFEIAKAPVNSLPTPPEIDGELEEGDPVGDIELPGDWEWKNPDETPTVEEGEEGIEVTIPVDDDNYDWTDVPGYNPETGEYETTVEVPVVKPQPSTDIDVSAPSLGQPSYEYGTPLSEIELIAGTLNGAAQGAQWQWEAEDAAAVYPGVVNDGYLARIEVDTVNYDWTGVEGYEDGYYYVRLNVSIYAKQVTVGWSNTQLTYNGSAQAPVASVSADQLVNGDTITFDYSVSGDKATMIGGAYAAVNAGSYHITASIADTLNYEIREGGECDFVINKAVVQIPASGGEIEGNGEEQVYIPEGFDDDVMDITGNVVKDEGDYTADVTLTDPDNYEWSDGSTDGKEITFSVVPGDWIIDLLWLIILLIILIIIEIIIAILIIRARDRLENGDNNPENPEGGENTTPVAAGAPMALMAARFIPWQVATVIVLAVIFVALLVADIVLYVRYRRAKSAIEGEEGLEQAVEEGAEYGANDYAQGQPAPAVEPQPEQSQDGQSYGQPQAEQPSDQPTEQSYGQSQPEQTYAEPQAEEAQDEPAYEDGQ